MKTTYKRFIAIFLTVMLIISALPISANAQTGTLGTEEPYLFCAFYDSNGNAVDGNSIEAGTYTVDVVLTDMATNSVFQYTADYNEDVIEISEVSSPYSEDNDVSLGGIKNSDGTLVVVLVSNDEACTSLSAETVFTTMTVTVTSENAIDFADYFTFNTDPDLTFVESDYGDGIEDAYTLDTTVSTTYEKYQMRADESPALSISVSGKIVIATTLDGDTGEDGIGGISVYTDVNYEPVAVSAADGTFTATVPKGTTVLILSNHTFENGEHSADSEGCTIDRTVTLSGTANVENAIIPIIICDYNSDGAVTSADKAFFNRAVNARPGEANYNAYCNLNCDSAVTSADKGIFNRFNGSVDRNYSYSETIIE